MPLKAICAVCYGNPPDTYEHEPPCEREGCPHRQTFAPISTFILCPKPDQCDHRWDGPEVELANGASASCSKCGMTAIAHSLRTAP